jgi:Ca2+/Na+ antiporter
MSATDNLSVLICISAILFILGCILQNKYMIGVGLTFLLIFYGFFVYYDKYKKKNKNKNSKYEQIDQTDQKEYINMGDVKLDGTDILAAGKNATGGWKWNGKEKDTKKVTQNANRNLSLDSNYESNSDDIRDRDSNYETERDSTYEMNNESSYASIYEDNPNIINNSTKDDDRNSNYESTNDDYYDEYRDNRSSSQYKYSQSEYDPYGNKILTESQKKRDKYARMSYKQLQEEYKKLGPMARLNTEFMEVYKIKEESFKNNELQNEIDKKNKDEEPGYLSYLAFLPILPFYAVYKGVEFISDLIDE